MQGYLKTRKYNLYCSPFSRWDVLQSV